MTASVARLALAAALTIALLACDARHAPDADSLAHGTTTPIVTPIVTPAVGTTIDDDTSAAPALDVLRAYYAAIGARDYARAYAAWGSDGPPGHPTREAFAQGFASTDSVRLTIGSAGRVEGAAGSRYVELPVTLRAFERGGREAAYAGTYTLRRSVVPGADSASMRWHLYRATLRPVDAAR